MKTKQTNTLSVNRLKQPVRKQHHRIQLSDGTTLTFEIDFIEIDDGRMEHGRIFIAGNIIK